MTREIPDPPTWTFGPITRTDIVRYQGASGDLNPIHHDDDAAQAVGYDTAFAPGMLHAGLLATYASRWLGSRNLRRFAVRFREPVWPGDTLDFSGQVVAVEELPGQTLVDVALVCRRQTGAAAVTGTARFELEHD